MGMSSFLLVRDSLSLRLVQKSPVRSAVLVTENDDVVFENNEKIADLFPVAFADGFALIAIDSRVTPQGQERSFAQLP
jgi:hypothetical protein